MSHIFVIEEMKVKTGVQVYLNIDIYWRRKYDKNETYSISKTLYEEHFRGPAPLTPGLLSVPTSICWPPGRLLNYGESRSTKIAQTQSLKTSCPRPARAPVTLTSANVKSACLISFLLEYLRGIKHP